jgi:hypothetical protein
MRLYYISGNGKTAVEKGRTCCGCSYKPKGGNVPMLLDTNHGFGISQLKKSLQSVKLDKPKSRYISF